MNLNEWWVNNSPQRMFAWLRQLPWWTATGPHSQRLRSRKLLKLSIACRKLEPGYAWEPGNGWYEADRDMPMPWSGPPDLLGGVLPEEFASLFCEDSRPKGKERADLLREVVGDPTRLTPVLRRSCRACHGPMNLRANTQHQLGLWVCSLDPDHVTDAVTVEEMRLVKAGGCLDWKHLTPVALEMARYAYGSQDFTGLPILADALEEAGCPDDTILTHLRGPDNHVRGCWALDVILGHV